MTVAGATRTVDYRGSGLGNGVIGEVVRRLCTVCASGAAGLGTFVVALVLVGPLLHSSVALGAEHPIFTITSEISSSPSDLVPASLAPGVTRYLRYTVHNQARVPITVTSIRAAVDPQASQPDACDPATNLDLRSAGFDGALVVPAHAGPSAGTTVVTEKISLLDRGESSRRCEGATFFFIYSGTATRKS